MAHTKQQTARKSTTDKDRLKQPATKLFHEGMMIKEADSVLKHSMEMIDLSYDSGCWIVSNKRIFGSRRVKDQAREMNRSVLIMRYFPLVTHSPQFGHSLK